VTARQCREPLAGGAPNCAGRNGAQVRFLLKALREIAKEAKKNKPDPDKIYAHATDAIDAATGAA